MTLQNSNRPPGGPYRSGDEWLALLIAFGFLGGAAGWIVLGRGLLPIQPAVTSDPSSWREPSIAISPTGPKPFPSQDAGALTDGDPVAQESVSSQITPQAPEHSDKRPDASSNRLGIGQPESTSPSKRGVTVPAPKVPAQEQTDSLPIVREPLPFTDIPERYWAKPYIDALAARGVLNGLPNGSFAPERSLTRAELAVQLANAFELRSKQSPQTFLDVPTAHWAAAAISESVAMGFLTGYPQQTFEPEQAVTRLQAITALSTGLSLPEPVSSDAILQPYRDREAIPDWGKEAVAAAIAAGIIRIPSEADAQLRPNDAATRAEIAAIIYAALSYMGKVKPI